MLMRLRQLGVLFGFECLPVSILLVHRANHRIIYANEMAHQTLNFSKRQWLKLTFDDLLDEENDLNIDQIDAQMNTDVHLLNRYREKLLVHLRMNVFEPLPELWLIQFFVLDKKDILEREIRFQDLSQVHRFLIRNLAHEIKNPLGGIKGAAQLLTLELDEHQQHLQEYTQVMIKEVDRLQSLLDRLLIPQRAIEATRMNVHEVCEHVCTMIIAEFPNGLKIIRDYDVSLPDFYADRNQLVQVLFNIMRNAAQALSSKIQRAAAEIVVSTRIARQVTLASVVHKLVLDWRIRDNGPGVSEHLREHIFYPLVSGREQGMGLGLTIAQQFVAQHGGRIYLNTIEEGVEFQILLPIKLSGNEKDSFTLEE